MMMTNINNAFSSLFLQQFFLHFSSHSFFHPNSLHSRTLKKIKLLNLKLYFTSSSGRNIFIALNSFWFFTLNNKKKINEINKFHSTCSTANNKFAICLGFITLFRSNDAELKFKASRRKS